jgi:hypothetical protein
LRTTLGGHLMGRFCRPPPPPTTRWSQGDSGGSQVSGCGFPTDTGCFLDPSQRPP